MKLSTRPSLLSAFHEYIEISNQPDCSRCGKGAQWHDLLSQLPSTIIEPRTFKVRYGTQLSIDDRYCSGLI